VLLGLALAGTVWGAAKGVAAWRFDKGLARAKANAASGRLDDVRRWLATLPPSRHENPEVADLRGVCEHEAGHYQAALNAWSLVPPDSPRAVPVALARARTLITDLGRYDEAETVLRDALRVRGPFALEVRHTLSQLYFLESRTYEMRRVIRDGWREWTNPPVELRDLWLLDGGVREIDAVRSPVSQAARLAPDDDRVWLAQAGVALLEGRLDEAARKLASCLKRRPDDPAVWRAKLRLGRLSLDSPGVETALTHLSGDRLTDADRLDALAWLASRRKDDAEERRLLERRVALGPVDLVPYERLIILASRAGETEQVEALRRRKAELTEVRERYRLLLADAPPAGGFSELATLAETLKRPFEAYGWWNLSARLHPGDPSALSGMSRLRKFRDAPAD